MEIVSKWPRLLVDGPAVSPELAGEILVRTDRWILCCNDRDWRAAVYDLVGIPRQGGNPVDWRDVDALRESIGALELAYLANDRIASAWIGGPHGWIDWDGRVGCADWNIGKWPSAEAVDHDWGLIARTWPELRLTAWLLEDEGAGPVCRQWKVGDGMALAVKPTPPRVVPVEVDAATVRARFALGGERGVSPERLAGAVEAARAARSG